MNKKITLEKLHSIRAKAPEALTTGLPDEVVLDFLDHSAFLRRAINDAFRVHSSLCEEFPELLKLDETALAQRVQEGILNFYPSGARAPYVPLAGRGPWIVTSHGAVIFDTGGYGMLGFGHTRAVAREVFSKHLVMANVMTPSFSQYRFVNAMREKIGYTRSKGSEPYAKFLCMNSGSESVTVATRLSDVHAKLMTDPGGRHDGKRVVFISLKGSFHGRTDRPAQVSSSCIDKYKLNLASWRGRDNLIEVEPNNLAQLEAAFERVVNNNVFVEAMLVEPVMGEGNPGLALTREFYDASRQLCNKHDALLIVDSVQAGLRATGCLSITDYPGFSDCKPPDMETFSKAINGGQFPVSVLALSDAAAGLYRDGIYGNTMCANPRALEVGRAVLGQVTDEVVKNIRERGQEFLTKLEHLREETDGAILCVQGTGLLLSAELEKDSFPVKDVDGVGRWLRTHGVNAIPGGQNAIRFTPYFNISSREIDLIVDVVRKAIEYFKGRK